MGRELRVSSKNMDWGVTPTHRNDSPWWGYQLDSIECQPCSGVGFTPPATEDEGPWCPVCEGEGTVRPQVQPPAYDAKYDSYGQIIAEHLRAGDSPDYYSKRYGYQLWETVSEGSPVTPVFDTLGELADWLMAYDTSVTRDATRADWIAMFDHGSAPSMISSPGMGVKSGVAAMGQLEAD